jgi:branched-chain amino acid transport system ATP-binding protein
MDEQSPALDIAALYAGYGRFDVVRDIVLKVAKGEAVALLGPNGAGKTTVLRAIMGLVNQRRGSNRVAGEDVSQLPAHRVARGFAAMAPEGRRLFLGQTVEDNLLLGAMHLRRDRARRRSSRKGGRRRSRSISRSPRLRRYGRLDCGEGSRR